MRVDAPPYSSKHLKKLFLDRDSVIFTDPPPPGGLLSFCREAKGKDETQSASGRFETGSAAGHTPRCDHRRCQPTIFLLSRLMMSLASMRKAWGGRQHATFPAGITLPQPNTKPNSPVQQTNPVKYSSHASLSELYSGSVIRTATLTTDDPSHPLHHSFRLLPSDRRYKVSLAHCHSICHNHPEHLEVNTALFNAPPNQLLFLTATLHALDMFCFFFLLLNVIVS